MSLGLPENIDSTYQVMIFVFCWSFRRGKELGWPRACGGRQILSNFQGPSTDRIGSAAFSLCFEENLPVVATLGFWKNSFVCLCRPCTSKGYKT